MQQISEEKAFGIFVHLMGQSSSAVFPTPLRTLFTPDMNGLHLALFQLSILIQNILPRLYRHFETGGVVATMFASQWFLTLFAYSLPLELVFRLFDLMVSEGAIVTMMRVSIALLKKNQNALLERRDLESILNHLKGSSLAEIYEGQFELLVKDTVAQSEKITERAIDDLRRRSVFYS
jgi:hypothetical protein